jgi:site-specific recombinase XerD
MATSTVIPAPKASLQPLIDRAAHFISQARATNTVAAYRSDWQHFTTWCAQHGAVELPAAPATIALYCADLASVAKVSTITRRLAAIAKAHQADGHESPCSTRNAAVAEVLAGIKREKGTLSGGKEPLLTDDVRRLLATLPRNLLGERDAALLLIGFAGGFRRSELAALNVEDLEECGDGLRVLLRRSKTDQVGTGRIVGIPFGSDPLTCPVRAYKRWLEASGITFGPAFRNVDRHGRMSTKAITPELSHSW